ncbi:hypothetical protein CYMTET_31236 [Cymbomonas tetramitiformis]|uniref:Uncharacterized protein n=1 Tax=Cymbomonas tetramitiformis TaxID=36881 RepID=A0AAE0FHE8_9CHLO|nr:hypothetical protein CYMTET_31236 [Cymbomonas tetramitiformis]
MSPTVCSQTTPDDPVVPTVVINTSTTGVGVGPEVHVVVGAYVVGADEGGCGGHGSAGGEGGGGGSGGRGGGSGGGG